MEIKKANKEDIEEIFKIYQSLIGTSGCTWSEDYPLLEDVQGDIKKNSTYIIVENDIIVAVASAGEDDEFKDIPVWNKNIKKFYDLHRVAVRKEFQNRGIAKILIKHIEEQVKNEGVDGIRFLASKTNPKALAVYNKLGYTVCGEIYMYDVDWWCYEKML